MSEHPDDTDARESSDTNDTSDNGDNSDLKAKMREALERKKGHDRGVPHPAGSKEKAHGSEVQGGGPKVHRRKAGGGGS